MVNNQKFSLQILKILSVVAVVLIHTLAAYYFALPSKTYDQRIFWVATDQIFRFSVPLFIALSGYGLMLGYGQQKLDLKHYFWRRIVRLLPWYLFFTTVIILAVTFIWHENNRLYGQTELWRLYLFGKADYHLYFIPLIIQLYLLFPFLLWLFKFIKPKIFVVAAFAWEVWWYLLIAGKTELVINNNSIWPDQVQYRNLVTWIFYFILGIYLATVVNRRLFLYFGFALTGVGLVLSIFNGVNLLSQEMDMIIVTRFTRLPVLLYATGVIILGKYLIDNITVNFKFPDISYIVYLGHTLILRVIFHQPGFAANIGPWVTGLISVLSSFAVGLLLDVFFKKLWLLKKAIVKA